jgi:S1-C subfamily serine protease
LGEEVVHLSVSPNRISGAVGRCTYSLRLAAEAYRGWRDCNGGAIPVRTVLRLPAPLAEETDAARAALLLLVLSPRTDVAPPLVQRFGLHVVPTSGPTGAKVARVTPLSAAARAGLDEGMIITRVGQEDIQTPAELEAALGRARPGATVMLRARWPSSNRVQLLSLLVPPVAQATGTGGSGSPEP